MVNEYHTIQNRINLNNQMISQIKETTETIYKQWFLDFGRVNGKGKPQNFWR